MTINLEDADIELDDVDITVYGDSIGFSVEGEIADVPSEVLNEFVGEKLEPVEITFEKK